MNFLGMFQKKKPNLKIGKNSKLYATAKIINFRNDAKLIEIGDHTHIRGEILLFAHGGQVRIGDFCYLGEGARIWSGLSISIGNRVLISHLVSIYDNTTHPLRSDKRHLHFRQILERGHPTVMDLGEKAVEISDDVWIGSHAIILRGVKIGRGSVVAAGSVVTKNVPAHTLVAGNPAKVVRPLEEPPQLYSPSDG